LQGAVTYHGGVRAGSSGENHDPIAGFSEEDPALATPCLEAESSGENHDPIAEFSEEGPALATPSQTLRVFL
jgi:hypothetical protein